VGPIVTSAVMAGQRGDGGVGEQVGGHQGQPGLAGAGYHVDVGPAGRGAGSARRSSLPLRVSGSLSSITNAAVIR